MDTLPLQSIDYSADANAAAKWRLAGGVHSKVLLFRAAGKGRGGAGIWHMIDGLSIASEARLDLWQGPACGAWPPKPCAHWSICYLQTKWMGHSCGGSQWGHRRKNPDAFCHRTAVFVLWWATVSHLREILSTMKVHMNDGWAACKQQTSTVTSNGIFGTFLELKSTVQ